jgi:hypothetical protein
MNRDRVACASTVGQARPGDHARDIVACASDLGSGDAAHLAAEAR